MAAISTYRPDYVVFPGRRTIRNLLRLAAAALSIDDADLDRERLRQVEEAAPCTR